MCISKNEKKNNKDDIKLNQGHHCLKNATLTIFTCLLKETGKENHLQSL